MDDCEWMRSLTDLAVKGEPSSSLLAGGRQRRPVVAGSGLRVQSLREMLLDSDTAPRFANKVLDVKTGNGEAQESFYFIELHFPAAPSNEFNSDEVSVISNALNGSSIIEIRRATVTDDLLAVLPSENAVADLQPQTDAIKKCPGSRGVLATAIAPPESGYDFTVNSLPLNSVNEDPVSGSAHCVVASYWCKKLGKFDVVGYVASHRGGRVRIHLDEQNQRVRVEGKRLLCDGTNCFSFKFNLLCMVILQFSSKNLYSDLLVLHLA